MGSVEPSALTPEIVIGLVLAALAGVLLGAFYFVGLWLTIQNMDRFKNPAVLFGVSFLLRTLLVLAGFFFVSGGRIERLAACLVAFFITRQIILSSAQLAKKHGRPSDAPGSRR
jgi:F1F0 ATPase subunit 2